MGPTYPAIHICTRAAALGLTAWDVIDTLSSENVSGIQFAAGAVTGVILSAVVYNRVLSTRESIGLAARRNCIFLGLSGIIPSGMTQVSTWLSEYILSSFVAGVRGGFVASQLIFPFRSNEHGTAFYSKGMKEW